MPELTPAAPGSPYWLATRPVLKLTPYSRHGLIHGAYDHARPPLARCGFHEAYADSWMYRRGFARGFLLAREATRD